LEKWLSTGHVMQEQRYVNLRLLCCWNTGTHVV